MAAGDAFTGLIGPVARELLGEPNARLSSATEWRYGTNGSLSIEIEKDGWYDHENQRGGGVLDLVQAFAGAANGHAAEWLQERGYLDPPRERDHSAPKRARIVATYDYVDEAGDLLFQVVRLHPKTFRQRRPDGQGGWVWSVKGVRLVPYRLPELIEDVGLERTILVVEGEKDVDNLRRAGLSATCNPRGAGKWTPDLNEHLAGADVVILPDNDDAGVDHAAKVAAMLAGVAGRVRILDLPGLPAKGDVSDWLAHGGTADALLELADRCARAPGDTPRRLHFGAEWLGVAIDRHQEPEWLVDDLLTVGDMSLVYGATGSGKSFLATHIAMGIARGIDVFGRKVRQGGVIYIAAEGQKGFRKRLRAYCQANDIAEPASIPFLLIPAAIDLYSPEGDIDLLLGDMPAILDRMAAFGVRIGLVVIDTYARVSRGANENASEDVSRVTHNFARIQEAAGDPHLMIVHHKNAGGEHPRGHTSLLAGVDNAIDVSADEDKNRTARVEKMKDGEDGLKLHFRLDPVTLGDREDGKKITSCVVVSAERSGPVTRATMAGLSPQAKIAYRALQEALLDHGEPAPAALKLPFGIRVIRYPFWRDRFEKIGMSGADGAKPSAVRQAMHRAGDQLLARGIIGKDDPYIWIARQPEGQP